MVKSLHKTNEMVQQNLYFEAPSRVEVVSLWLIFQPWFKKFCFHFPPNKQYIWFSYFQSKIQTKKPTLSPFNLQVLFIYWNAPEDRELRIKVFIAMLSRILTKPLLALWKGFSLISYLMLQQSEKDNGDFLATWKIETMAIVVCNSGP